MTSSRRWIPIILISAWMSAGAGACDDDVECRPATVVVETGGYGLVNLACPGLSRDNVVELGLVLPPGIEAVSQIYLEGMPNEYVLLVAANADLAEGRTVVDYSITLATTGPDRVRGEGRLSIQVVPQKVDPNGELIFDRREVVSGQPVTITAPSEFTLFEPSLQTLDAKPQVYTASGEKVFVTEARASRLIDHPLSARRYHAVTFENESVRVLRGVVTIAPPPGQEQLKVDLQLVSAQPLFPNDVIELRAVASGGSGQYTYTFEPGGESPDGLLRTTIDEAQTFRVIAGDGVQLTEGSLLVETFTVTLASTSMIMIGIATDFTAVTTGGSGEFTYVWSIDGVVVEGANQRTLSTSFDRPASIRATVTDHGRSIFDERSVTPIAQPNFDYEITLDSISAQTESGFRPEVEGLPLVVMHDPLRYEWELQFAGDTPAGAPHEHSCEAPALCASMEGMALNGCSPAAGTRMCNGVLWHRLQSGRWLISLTVTDDTGLIGKTLEPLELIRP